MKGREGKGRELKRLLVIFQPRTSTTPLWVQQPTDHIAFLLLSDKGPSSFSSISFFLFLFFCGPRPYPTYRIVA